MPEFNSSLQEQFVRLFAENHRRLFAYVQALLYDRHDAEEVFQETSLILWREFETFRQDEPFMPWAIGIAFNQIRKFRRKKRGSRLTFSDALLEELAKDAAEMGEEADELQGALAWCLEKLSDRNRRLVESIYGRHMAAGDVAQEWDRSVNTVYWTLKQVRKKLYDCITQRMSSDD